MPETTRDRIAQLLFSHSGLGLSMYRYNIGGGGQILNPKRFTPGYLMADGAYNWSADPDGRDMLARAARYGVPSLVAFANAAPPQFTTNGKGCGGELRADRVSQYAVYLARVVAHLSGGGTPLKLVSPMNEPDSSFSTCRQEGMKVPVALRAPLVAAVHKELTALGSPAGVVADESNGTGILLSEAPVWLGKLTLPPAAIVYHAYNSPDAAQLQAVRALGAGVSRPVFMSEVCCLFNDRYSIGFHPGMESGIWLARTIWSNLTEAGASSFSWWVALSPELGCDARTPTCGTLVNSQGWDDGLVYYDGNYSTDHNLRLVLTKRYWAYAQFSRWITPGMRPHAVSGSTGGAEVLVFEGNGRTVVVAISPEGAKASTRVSLELPWLSSATATVYRTSPTQNAAVAASVSVAGGVLPMTMPVQSVTTYVLSA
jgi:O-glycosyl hydrolase